MFGICNLSIIPIRLEPNHKSELVTQLLFGEAFEILQKDKQWLYINLLHDNYKGWMDYQTFEVIDFQEIKSYVDKTLLYLNSISCTVNYNNNYLNITKGACINLLADSNLQELEVISGKQPKTKLIETAKSYLHTPYLWGGKTPFGIDCSGLTQMVYKLNGYNLPRDASEQGKLGEALSFIEESEPGDLAFFDNDAGLITHVGMILGNNYIIHASGKVRIDRIDHNGIFNIEVKKHTHQLRVIKKII